MRFRDFPLRVTMALAVHKSRCLDVRRAGDPFQKVRAITMQTAT